MLSGIGPKAHLQSLGIKVVMDSPGVGQNLMDHLEVYVQQTCVAPISLHKHLGLLGRAKIGMQWLYDQTGLGATNHFEVGGFIRSDERQSQPDIQFHFYLLPCPTMGPQRRAATVSGSCWADAAKEPWFGNLAQQSSRRCAENSVQLYDSCR